MSAYNLYTVMLLHVSHIILFDECVCVWDALHAFISNVINKCFRMLRAFWIIQGDYYEWESRKSATSSLDGVARLTPEDVNFHDRTVFLLPLPPLRPS